MSLDHEPIDEPAIRRGLEHRRPTAVPPELIARVATVPREIQQLRPMPVRVTLAVAPWLALAAAAVVLAFGPRFLATPPGTAAGALDPGATWTPTNPGGGFASEGFFRVPWSLAILLGAAVLIVQSVWTTVRRARQGRDGEATARPPRPTTKVATLRAAGTFVLTIAVIAVWSIAASSLVHLDPILYGSSFGPGPEMTELKHNGNWDDETLDLEWLQGGAPNYVFRVWPGDAFSTVMSIRNDWPIPITVLGLQRDDGVTTDSLLAGADAVQNGLGLLRDPERIDAAPGNVVAFRPVVLGPGEEVVLVVAWVAGSCADPAAEATYHDSFSSATRPEVTLVYDVFGWRRAGWTAPPFDMTVPVMPGCLGS